MLVTGLAFLFIAVEFPLLLLMAAVLIGIWKLMTKSTPKPIKEEEGSDFVPTEEKVLKPQGSDAFYAEIARKFDVKVVDLSLDEQPKK